MARKRKEGLPSADAGVTGAPGAGVTPGVPVVKNKGGRPKVPKVPLLDLEGRPEWLAGLTAGEDRFCVEYLKLGNAASAAIAAGLVGEQAARGAARVKAHRLLLVPGIQARIRQIHDADISGRMATLDNVRAEMARVAFSRPAAFYDKDGALKPIHDLDDNAQAALSGIEEETYKDFTEGVEVGERKVKKIKLWSKTQALRDLGEMLGGFESKRPVTQLYISIKL